PAAAGEVSDEARRSSLSAMTNLMCPGRKRGLAGVIATPRLAKLAQNVAAEAANPPMGRTLLDIDMVRAADLLGMERRQAEQIRDLERGHFLGLGPAVSRRPVAVKIGSVRTAAKSVAAGFMPPPSATRGEMEAILHAEPEGVAARSEIPSPPRPVMTSASELQGQIAVQAHVENSMSEIALDPDEAERLVAEVLTEMSKDEGCTFQTTAALFQDFT